MFGKIRKGKLIIEIPFQKPKLSHSGKTLVVASSRGVRRSALKIEGKPVYVVANAYIRKGTPPAPVAKKESARNKARDRRSGRERV